MLWTPPFDSPGTGRSAQNAFSVRLVERCAYFDLPSQRECGVENPIMNALNTQFEKFRQSQTVALADRVSALKDSGRRIIGLQMGDPDFVTPPAVVNVALAAIQEGFTHYAPSRGLQELRRAVATKLQRNNTAAYDPETEVLITHG